jgi:hypothetical protein
MDLSLEILYSIDIKRELAALANCCKTCKNDISEKCNVIGET